MSDIKLKAFWVEVNGYDTIVFAATPAKAKWLAVSGYWFVYGKKQGWPELYCRREPQFDNSPLAKQGRRCWSPDYVRGYSTCHRSGDQLTFTHAAACGAAMG